jgi:hypothetical protein
MLVTLAALAILTVFMYGVRLGMWSGGLSIRYGWFTVPVVGLGDLAAGVIAVAPSMPSERVLDPAGLLLCLVAILLPIARSISLVTGV